MTRNGKLLAKSWLFHVNQLLSRLLPALLISVISLSDIRTKSNRKPSWYFLINVLVISLWLSLHVLADKKCQIWPVGFDLTFVPSTTSPAAVHSIVAAAGIWTGAVGPGLCSSWCKRDCYCYFSDQPLVATFRAFQRLPFLPVHGLLLSWLLMIAPPLPHITVFWDI